MPAWPEFHLGALLRRLDAAGVEFVAIGGIAAIAHGSPQITQDLGHDLIAMEKAAGRPKDGIYVEELEAIRRLGG